MSRLIIQMGTTVSSQVLNMIIYILMVLQSIGLEKKKKVDKIGKSFILFSIWDNAGHRKPWITQRARLGKVIIQLWQLFLENSDLLGPYSMYWYVKLWCGENFSYLLSPTAFPLEFYSQPSHLRTGIERDFPNKEQFWNKVNFSQVDPNWSKGSPKEVRGGIFSIWWLPFHIGLSKTTDFSLP